MGIAATAVGLAFKSVGGWIFGNIRLIGLGLLVTALVGAAWKINGWKTDRDALLQEREGNIASLTHDLVVSEMKAENERIFREAAEADKLRQELLYRDTLMVQSQIRDEIKTTRKIFKDHDVNKLVNENPEAMQRLSNAATKRKLDELESVYND